MNNPTTHVAVTMKTVAALAVTLTVHITVASGIIWGGWMETQSMGLIPKPREVLITVNMGGAIPAQTNKPEIQVEEKNQKTPSPEKAEAIQKPAISVPVNPESTIPDPPKKNTPLYSSATNEKPEKTNQKQISINGESQFYHETSNNNYSSLNPIPKSTTSQPARSATAPRQIPHTRLQPQTAVKISHNQVVLNQDSLPQASEKQATIQPYDLLNDLLPLQNEAANKSLVPILPEGQKTPSIAEQKRRVDAGMLVSRKVKEDVAVARIRDSALDVHLTGYGEYDTRFIQAVRISWLKFMGKTGWHHPGKVVIDFKLHHDGTISNLEIKQNLAKPIQIYYCKRALGMSAPFDKWTEAMRSKMSSNVRSCRFSFRY